MAFSQMLRRCDFTETDYNGPTGVGRPLGTIRSNGSTVTADVQLATAIAGHALRHQADPDAPAVVGDLLWRRSRRGAGFVEYGRVGAAATTLQDAIEPGATGAWVFISRPSAFSQDPAEFYTTDFVAPIYAIGTVLRAGHVVRRAPRRSGDASCAVPLACLRAVRSSRPRPASSGSDLVVARTRASRPLCALLK